MKQLFTQSRDCTVVRVEGLETHNVFLTNQHYARTLNVSGYMLEIKDIPGARITGHVSKKKSLFLWQGQNLCGLSLAFIIDWRLVQENGEGVLFLKKGRMGPSYLAFMNEKLIMNDYFSISYQCESQCET